ncbi:MAG: succinate dehydrogenase/fumarate reductase flavoprotein subunit [Gammaproteobacteria bacterium]|nr:MAG: succinate dehydrogenase/fumarate reductase flavoprotein subunit [Gammaproteobacteria bacterium]
MEEQIKMSADLLVVGGGIGGAHAALRAAELGAEVILVEKAVVARAGPMTFVHSQFAPDHPVTEDELLPWIEEFVLGANYMVDQDWVKQFVLESYGRIQQQIDWGVPYNTDSSGQLKYAKVRGQKVSTSLGVDGRVNMEILRRRLKASRRVTLIEKVAVVDLLTSDGIRPTNADISGAVGIHVRTGQPHVFQAKNVLLNTGPWYPKMHFAFADHCTGEGHGAAWRAGAEFAGMEFAQFAAWSYFNNEFFTPGQAKIQGIGAHFINAAGECFMDRYDPVWGEQSGLFQVARAIMTENIEGRGPCMLDFRHISQADMEVLYEVSPSVGQAFKEFNIDPSKDLLELNPFVVVGSGTSGSAGPDIGLNGETNIDGLYAAGWCTSNPTAMTGINGGGATASAVGGYRAGEHAAKRADSIDMPQVHDDQVKQSLDDYFKPMRKLRQVRAADIWMKIGEITTRTTFSLYKTEESIDQAIHDLCDLRDEMVPKIYAPDYHELEKASEVRNYLDMAILACRAMRLRTESRGELFRADYPYMDNDNWLKWIILRSQSGSDEPVVSYRELPYERWPVKAPPGRTPSPYLVK